MRIRERKYYKTLLRLSGNRLMKNNVTPLGFLSHSDYPLYNHFTPLRLASDLDYTINNHVTPLGLNSYSDSSVYKHGTPSGLLKSRRDDMIIEQLINKQLNPVGVI